MNETPISTSTAGANTSPQAAIKIFGVGGAGTRVIEELAARVMPGVCCIAAGSPEECQAAISARERVCLESRKGYGPAQAAALSPADLAAQNVSKLRASFEGAATILIVAGLGGATGSEVLPALARAAREGGSLVLAFVTLPFDWEGNLRQQRAQRALVELSAGAHAVICLPGRKMFKLIDDKAGVVRTFKTLDELLAQCAAGIYGLLTRKSLLEIHVEDLCGLLRNHTESAFAVAEASGPTRSRDVVDRLLAHPMLEGGAVLSDASVVLVSLVGGSDLSMMEIHKVMEGIAGRCPHARVITGTAVDEAFGDRVAITLIAARGHEESGAGPHSGGAETPGQDALESQLLNNATTHRPHSRFLPPPPPTLSSDQMERLMAKQGTGPRSRKAAPRMRQGQLPLEIVSRGRFDKSEPTIYKGEDLDVPTYIRRGVALN